MTKPSSTWIPIYIGDYLADTGHLTVAEHGAYHLLIYAYWRNAGPLPADDQQLRRISRMTEQEWAASRETMAAFFTIRDDHWHHKRIDQELRLAENRAAKAKNAAGMRWHARSMLGASSEHARSMPGACSSNAQAMLGRCSSQSQRDPQFLKNLLNQNTDRDLRENIQDSIRAHAREATFDHFWSVYPRRSGKASALKAFTKALKAGTDPDTILAGAERYRDDPNRDPSYTKLPATWLNAGCWSDDPLPTRKGNGHDTAGNLETILRATERATSNEHRRRTDQSPNPPPAGDHGPVERNHGDHDHRMGNPGRQGMANPVSDLPSSHSRPPGRHPPKSND